MDVILLEDDILLFSKLWGERLNLVSPDLCLFILWFNRKVRWVLLKCFVIYFSTECNEKHPTPRPHSPSPLLRVKHWLNGCCISLCLKKYSFIYICTWTQNGWTSLGGPWDQIINREIRVYVCKNLKTHFMEKLTFEQNLKIFYYLGRFVYKSMSHKISHLKANIDTYPNGEHKNQSWNVTGLFQCDLGL